MNNSDDNLDTDTGADAYTETGTEAFADMDTSMEFNTASDSGSAPKPREIRIGTTVWGLIIITLGVLLVMWGNGATFDPQLTMIALLFGAGFLLIFGSLLTVLRGRGRRDRD